jgi:hypothetical protein
MPTELAPNTEFLFRKIRSLFDLERDVSIRIWSYLDQPQHMNILSGFALTALVHMMDVSEPLFLYTKSRVETKLAIYRYGTKWEDLVRAITAANVTPGDVADVIRLYGAWVEAGAPKDKKNYYEEALKREKEEEEKKGKTLDIAKIKRDLGLEQKPPPNLDKKLEEKETHRTGPAGTWTTFRDRGATRGQALLYKYVQEERVRLHPRIKEYIEKEYRGVSASHPGAMKFTLAEGGAPVLIDEKEHVSAGRLGKGPTAMSTVGRMERMFGLLDLAEKSEGADISGTTADQVYFLKYFSRETNVPIDPILYLLPVATLVAPYHHSILEVALTLSFKGIIDYTAGLYDTLKPLEQTKYMDLINDILRPMANDPRNSFMLVHYTGPWIPKGCWLYEPRLPGEIDRWKKVARLAGTTYLKCTHFAGGQGWPNRTDLQNVIR